MVGGSGDDDWWVALGAMIGGGTRGDDWEELGAVKGAILWKR